MGVSDSIGQNGETTTLSRAEAARRCGVTTRTLDRWVKSGRLSAVAGRYVAAELDSLDLGADAEVALPEALARSLLASMASREAAAQRFGELTESSQRRLLARLDRAEQQSIEAIELAKTVILDQAKQEAARITSDAEAERANARDELLRGIAKEVLPMLGPMGAAMLRKHGGSTAIAQRLEGNGLTAALAKMPPERRAALEAVLTDEQRSAFTMLANIASGEAHATCAAAIKDGLTDEQKEKLLALLSDEERVALLAAISGQL